MRFSIRFLPVILFFIFYSIIQVSFTSLRYLQEMEDAKETMVIQEIVVDRFQQYLQLPLMISSLGAQYVSDANLLTVNYEKYASLVQKNNPEFLGFNIIDHMGLIIRTYPQDENIGAQGKSTQMHEFLKESKENSEPYFLSPPFRLFQGQQGFVFYSPINSSSKFKGWYAIAISSDAFLKRFRLEEFLELFELVINDVETGKDYFATSIPPTKGTEIYEKTFDIYNRKMTFKTWRKEETLIYSFPWYFSGIISLLMAVGIAYMLRLYDQRRKVSNQLQNISLLLQVTSKEALSNLIEIHSDFHRLNLPNNEHTESLSRDINYLSNLIEQIDLLQTMAHNREGISGDESEFLKLLQNQLEHFGDVLIRKNIRVLYESKDFKDLSIRANVWLIEHSVLSNVFSHLLIHMDRDSAIRIEKEIKGDSLAISFRAVCHPSSLRNLPTMHRRMDVARKVLQLHHGDLRESTIGENEIVVTVFLPQ